MKTSSLVFALWVLEQAENNKFLITKDFEDRSRYPPTEESECASEYFCHLDLDSSF